jgi:ATP-binding cassette subfamily F protein 3
LGNHVEVAYFDQELSDLNPTRTVLDSLWDLDPAADGGRIRSFLARFGFTGDDPFKVVSSLSGGEKTKLSLARLLYHPANFIIFDEPTNHLDMDSREALEEALLEYEGSCLIVSHDRYFLDRVANRILHIENGRLDIYEGNYSYFRERNEPGDAVRKPKSSKSRNDYLAFKEQSRRRGRLKKDLQKTKERIEQAETDLCQIEIDLTDNIPSSDWEQLQTVHEKKDNLEAELLELYAHLEQLEATNLD